MNELLQKLRYDRKWQFLLLLCIGCGLYVFIRIFTLGLTHDEAVSYFTTQGDPEFVFSANNHLLNTELMRLSVWLFGAHDWALRLPSVAAFGLYLLFALLLMNEIKTFRLQLAGMALLLFNPFLLDFFSLARGYAWSMAGLLAMIYLLSLLSRSLDDNRKSRSGLLLFVVFAAITLTANLNMLPVTLVIFLSMCWLIIRKGQLKSHLLWLLPALVLFLFMFYHAWRLQEAGQFYYGSESAVHALKSLVVASLYADTYPFWVKALLYLFLPGFALLFIPTLYLTRKTTHSMLQHLSWIFVGTLIVFTATHLLLGTRFPFDRAILFLIPLLGLLVVFSLDALEQTPTKWHQVVSSFSSRAIVLVLLLHLFLTASLSFTQAWKHEAHSYDVLQFIREEKLKQADFYWTAHWVFQPALNFYRHTEFPRWEKLKNVDYPEDARYIYEFTDRFHDPNYRLIRFYPDTKTGVFETAYH